MTDDHHVMQPDKSMTDSGIVQPPNEIKLNKIMNSYTYLRVYEEMMVASIDVTEEERGIETSLTELDSHANIPGVRRNADVILDTKKTKKLRILF